MRFIAEGEVKANPEPLGRSLNPAPELDLPGIHTTRGAKVNMHDRPIDDGAAAALSAAAPLACVVCGSEATVVYRSMDGARATGFCQAYPICAPNGLA
jgi:hypothetical protein